MTDRPDDCLYVRGWSGVITRGCSPAAGFRAPPGPSHFLLRAQEKVTKAQGIHARGARTLRKAKSQKQNQSERIKPAVRHTPYRRAAPAPSARMDARRSTWGP